MHLVKEDRQMHPLMFHNAMWNVNNFDNIPKVMNKYASIVFELKYKKQTKTN